MKQFSALNKTLQLDSLESVDDSVSLNEDQLALLDAAIQRADTLQSEKQGAVDEKEAAVLNYNAALSLMDELEESVKAAETPEEKVQAIRSLLAAKPGANPSNPKSEDDLKHSGEVDWDTIDGLPHNKNID